MYSLHGLLLLGVLTAAEPPPPTAASASQTNGPVPFQPGVYIDWRRREVQVQTRVVLRDGPLEFLACWPGKEHESILRFEAAAVHVYMALGLMGLEPGHPPIWNTQHQRYDAPAGNLVDISMRWEDAAGPRTADASEWLREVEYARPPLPRPWVFAGSLRRPDGTLAAEYSGVGVALVDFPDGLICYSRRYPSRYGALWAEAHTPAIPPIDTPVRLIVRPARPRPLSVELDFRGVVWANGRYCTPTDLADLVLRAQQLEPERVQTIHVYGALRSDVARLNQELRAAGVPSQRIRCVPCRTSTGEERGI